MGVATFGERLKHAMSVRGVSSAQLSRDTRISDGQITHLRKGTRGKEPGADLAIKIARALSISVEWLVTGEGLPPESQELPLRLRHRPEWAAIAARIRDEHPEIDAVVLEQVGDVVDDPRSTPGPLDVPLVRDMAAAVAAWRVRAVRRTP